MYGVWHQKETVLSQYNLFPIIQVIYNRNIIQQLDQVYPMSINSL